MRINLDLKINIPQKYTIFLCMVIYLELILVLMLEI